MTSNKEDYLKAIYDAGGFDTYVSNKVIAEKLAVAPASVSEMLTKLQTDGVIEYKAYHGSKLTEKGLNNCIEIVRSHELWEVFLIRHLGYTWWEAHEEAHHLEHAASEKMIERLDAFLGHPETCPHGKIIPKKGQPIPKRREPLVKLSDLHTDQTAQIALITEDQKLLDYLQRSGLGMGRDIRIIDKEEYEGPITFVQDEQTISISYKAATQVFVKVKK